MSHKNPMVSSFPRVWSAQSSPAGPSLPGLHRDRDCPRRPPAAAAVLGTGRSPAGVEPAVSDLAKYPSSTATCQSRPKCCQRPSSPRYARPSRANRFRLLPIRSAEHFNLSATSRGAPGHLRSPCLHPLNSRKLSITVRLRERSGQPLGHKPNLYLRHAYPVGSASSLGKRCWISTIVGGSSGRRHGPTVPELTG